MVEVVTSRCPADHPCPLVRMCPAEAIKQEGFDAPVVNEVKCTNCGICVKSCPYGAMKFPAAV